MTHVEVGAWRRDRGEHAQRAAWSQSLTARMNLFRLILSIMTMSIERS